MAAMTDSKASPTPRSRPRAGLQRSGARIVHQSRPMLNQRPGGVPVVARRLKSGRWDAGTGLLHINRGPNRNGIMSQLADAFSSQHWFTAAARWPLLG